MPTRREAVQAFCPEGKTLAQAEFSSAEQIGRTVCAPSLFRGPPGR